MSRARINTEFWAKPIPLRSFDWCATFDDYDGAPDSHCPIGYGATEREAIDDLLTHDPDDTVKRICEALWHRDMDADEARKWLERAGVDPSEIEDLIGMEVA